MFMSGSWTVCFSFGGQKRPENVAQLRAHIVKLCCTLSEDLCRKVVMNTRVRLQEVVRQNGGHIEHVLHWEQFSSLWGLILYQMSNVFIIIKMCTCTINSMTFRAPLCICHDKFGVRWSCTSNGFWNYQWMNEYFGGRLDSFWKWPDAHCEKCKKS